MPRAFSEAEKNRIRERLKKAAAAALERNGIKKTSVEELCRSAGISKGAFYLFHHSKEELFMDVLEELEREFRAAALKGLFEDGCDARESLRRFLLRVMDGIERTPLMVRLTGEDVDALSAGLPPERLEAHLRNDETAIEALAEQWTERGFLRELPPGSLSALFRNLVLFVMYRETFGDDRYRFSREIIADMTAAYIAGDAVPLPGAKLPGNGEDKNGH